MIRVLQFADVINRFDFIDVIVQSSDRADFEMAVCVRTEDHNIAKPEFPEGTKYRLIPGNSRRDALQTAWKLSRLLKEWEIDVVHAHHFEQAIIGWIATRLNRKTKLVIGRHYSDSIYRQPSAVKQKVLLELEQTINRAADRIIVPSKYIFEILTQRQGVDSKKIDVVLYGFDPKKYSTVSKMDVRRIRDEFGIDSRIVFGNFSRLHEEKGQRYLIAAAKDVVRAMPDALILIVGEGTERNALERQIEDGGLERNVKLLGWRKDAMAIMSAIDVVVQSTLQEAFSQVMCEALWLGKPLVITDVSGVRDIIVENENGIVVSKESPVELSDAMITLGNRPEERKRIGENGRKYISSELTVDKMIRHYEKSYKKAMDS